MAFFRNSTVNLLNLHYGIHSIALSGAGAFYIVYLLKAGVSVPGVLMALAGILAGRFLIRPIVVPIGARVGMRALVIAGTFLSAMQYPIVAQVHGVGLPLFALIVVAAIGDSVYWSSYHAYFAALGDQEHRGQQIGIREAIGAIVGIVSPLVSGWLLVTFGAQVAFGATAFVLVAAALPILFTPDVPVPAHAPGAIQSAMLGAALFLTDGWVCSGYYFAWQIALFLSLGESFLAYGGALAIAAVAGGIAGMVLGRYIDLGNGGRAIWFAYGGFLLTVIIRAIAPGHPTLAVLANAIGAVEACLYIPTEMTAVYNMAKRSPDTLRFHVVAEGGWDIGAASSCLLIAALAWFGVSLSVGILTSLLGAGVSFVLLRRYYASHAVAESDVVMMETAAAQPPTI
jgi:hypothetical protein